MGHPLLDEFCRQSGELRFEFYRRCQRVFRDEVNPMLDEREKLLTENADLKAQLAKLQSKAAARRGESAA